jgi:hypothetical protein
MDGQLILDFQAFFYVGEGQAKETYRRETAPRWMMFFDNVLGRLSVPEDGFVAGGKVLMMIML